MTTQTAQRALICSGTFIHSESQKALEYIHDAVVCVDAQGTIVRVEKECGDDLTQVREKLLKELGWEEGEVDFVTGKEGQFFFPGFIGKSDSVGTFCGLDTRLTDRLLQTPMYMPRNIPTSAYLASQPSSTG